MSNFVERSINGKKEKRLKLVEEYFNEVQPEMSYKDFEDICKTPFLHMKKTMSTGKLYEFRYRYLGKFTPRPEVLVWLLQKSKKMLELGKMDQTTYNLNVLTVTDYITKNISIISKLKKDLQEDLKKWIKF